MARTPKPDLRFSVRTPEHDWGPGSRYLNVEARIVVLDEHRAQPEWVYPRDYGDHNQWADLVVAAQMGDSHGHGDFYGRDITFAPHRVNAQRAESMAKVFRSLERKMTDSDARLGYPTDFASYLARVAIAIGMPEVRCFGKPSQIHADGHTWLDVDGLRYHLAEAVRTWRAKWGLADAA